MWEQLDVPPAPLKFFLVINHRMNLFHRISEVISSIKSHVALVHLQEGKENYVGFFFFQNTFLFVLFIVVLLEYWWNISFVLYIVRKQQIVVNLQMEILTVVCVSSYLKMYKIHRVLIVCQYCFFFRWPFTGETFLGFVWDFRTVSDSRPHAAIQILKSFRAIYHFATVNDYRLFFQLFVPFLPCNA